MSITAVGVALDLDGPLPVARRFSLLTTPGVVVEDSDRWMNGVNVIGYPAGTPSSWEPCSTGTMRVKSAADNAQPQARFDPVAHYFPLTCSTLGLSNAGIARLADRIEEALDATLSFAVERSLAAGTVLSTNPSMGDGNMTALAGGVAVSPQEGQGYLENAIGLTGRQGMIHATPAVVSAWGFGAGLDDADVDDPPPPRTLRTANGTPVISGAGYIGVHPVGQVGPGDTTDWVFATGPVEVRVAEPNETSIEDSVDHTDNSIVILAERFALAEWDTALQVGVLIDWSL